jgi:hypothetical protein
MKSLLGVFSFSLLFVLLPHAALSEVDGAPFAVIGERVDHPVPKGWKLAWMGGKPDGRFVVEYIPASEQIDSWRGGYLAIERLPYPSPEVLDELASKKQAASEFALSLYIQMAKKNCGGKHESMSQRSNVFNGAIFSVGGGFCGRYGPAAPFGEGALVAFVQGKSFLFRIQYGWRPKSAQELSANLPWRITSQVAQKYLGAIKASSLCAGVGQPECESGKLSESLRNR